MILDEAKVFLSSAGRLESRPYMSFRPYLTFNDWHTALSHVLKEFIRIILIRKIKQYYNPQFKYQASSIFPLRLLGLFFDHYTKPWSFRYVIL